ncbi:hypothetical protein PR048_002843 [Dryococelus australis]|uniref:Uncharacterized protein n=1 Tax=Dryococelus australis TaxID=614101 RepID=A0ABQ9ILC3_9NEOP|nr:hypothetical protein PR048_002843 [Dryococelus australis]
MASIPRVHETHGAEGATAVWWVDYSSPPKANRVRFPAGWPPDFRTRDSCRTMPLDGGISRGTPVSNPALLHTHFASPLHRFSRPRRLRAAHISSLARMRRDIDSWPLDSYPRLFVGAGSWVRVNHPTTSRTHVRKRTVTVLQTFKIKPMRGSSVQRCRNHVEKSTRGAKSAGRIDCTLWRTSQTMLGATPFARAIVRVLVDGLCSTCCSTASSNSGLRRLFGAPQSFLSAVKVPRSPSRCVIVAKRVCDIVAQVKALAFHRGKQSSIPGGVGPDFRTWYLRFLPPLHSSAAPFSSRFTLIDSRHHGLSKTLGRYTAYYILHPKHYSKGCSWQIDVPETSERLGPRTREAATSVERQAGPEVTALLTLRAGGVPLSDLAFRATGGATVGVPPLALLLNPSSNFIPPPTHLEIVRLDATGRRVLSGIPPPSRPPLHSCAAPVTPYFTHISSQYLDSGGKQEIPEKTLRPAASYDTISTCANPGVIRPGIEPGSPWWEASRLTAQAPRSLKELYVNVLSVSTNQFGFGSTAPFIELFRPDDGNKHFQVTCIHIFTCLLLYIACLTPPQGVFQGQASSNLRSVRRFTKVSRHVRQVSLLGLLYSRRWVDRTSAPGVRRQQLDEQAERRVATSVASAIVESADCEHRYSEGVSPLKEDPWSVFPHSLTPLHACITGPLLKDSLCLKDRSGVLVIPLASRHGKMGSIPDGNQNQLVFPQCGCRQPRLPSASFPSPGPPWLSGEPCSIPGRVTTGLSHVGIVPDDAAGRRVLFGDLPFPPALAFRRCPSRSLISITLIGSHDLAVMSRPNLFTHLPLLFLPRLNPRPLHGH